MVFTFTFRENNNVVVFSFPFHMLLANLWFFRLQGQFTFLRTSFPVLYPLIHPLILGRERILIPEFIRSPPLLTVYDVAHSLPLGDIDRVFSFPENVAQRHFLYPFSTFRQALYYSLNFSLSVHKGLEVIRHSCEENWIVKLSKNIRSY